MVVSQGIFLLFILEAEKMAGRAFATMLKPQQRSAKKTQRIGKSINILSSGTVYILAFRVVAVKYQRVNCAGWREQEADPVRLWHSSCPAKLLRKGRVGNPSEA
jgi:hypothetical protein